MTIDQDISVLQGSEIEAGLGLPVAAFEQIGRRLSVNWSEIPGTNIRIYASLRPEITGLNNIIYRIRRSVANPVNIGTLASIILDSATELPGGPRDLFLDSGIIAKPAGVDVVQLTTEGVGGGSANDAGTIELGIEPDTSGPILGFSNLRPSTTLGGAAELFILEFRVDFTRFSSANVRLVAGMHYRNQNFAVAPLNLRQGGTYQGVDGAIIGTINVPTNNNGYVSVGATIVNPNTVTSIKICSGALGTQTVDSPFLWVQEV